MFLVFNNLLYHYISIDKTSYFILYKGGGTTFYYLNDLAYSWNGTLGDRYVSRKLTEHGKAELSNNCSTIELYYHSCTDSTLVQLWDFCGQESGEVEQVGGESKLEELK